MADVHEDDFVFVDWEGKHSSGQKPSKEISFHKGIYQVRAEINSVVHLHSPFCIALSLAGEQFPLVTVSAKKIIGNAPLVPAADPGSPELAHAVTAAFQQ